AGHDALGDDPRRHAALYPRRARRRCDPRARPRARRGHRRAADDRRNARHLALALRERRHARGAHRRAVPGRDVGPADGVARLPRADPPRDLARHESGRPDHRATVRATAGGPLMTTPDRAAFSLTPTPQLRRRKLVGRIVEGSMYLSALAAIFVLGAVVWAVV